MVEISHPSVVLTAFKPGPARSTILRVYEASGMGAHGVRIRLNAAIAGAYIANLLEDTRRRLAVQENTLQFDLRPFEILTLRLKLVPRSKVSAAKG
jgi:alpha-mannosidase